MLNYSDAKKEINIFLLRGSIIYAFLLIALAIFKVKTNSPLDCVWISITFMALLLIIFIIWGAINSYIYFVKRKGRSPALTPWEEMKPFEKYYYVKVRKIWILYLIMIGETIIFILITQFFNG
jgi:hypothetical protein